MTTKAEEATFEAYIARVMPEALKSDMPPPTWTGGPAEWVEHLAAARAYWRAKAVYDYVMAIAERGHYPYELASGKLGEGAVTQLATGRVVRPQESTTTPDMEARARQAVQGLRLGNVAFDPILAARLEAMAYGRWTGDPRQVAPTVDAAENAIRQAAGERQAQAQEQAVRPTLTVRQPFRAIGGKVWPAGRYQITPEEAAELRDWQGKMEAQAKQRRWDAPEGYTPETWPPFTLVL